jgi:tol-pal system protein YbgF
VKVRLLGTLVVCVLAASIPAAGQSKRTYELIYDDIQVLKQKILQIEERLDRNAGELKSLREQVKALGDQLQRWQAGQFGLQEDLKTLPARYQTLHEKIDQVQARLGQILAEFAAVRLPGESAEGRDPTKIPEGDPAAVSPSGLSPREVYSAAYADYVNENFELAAEGFRLYREQFPDSPLADTALYWMGECFFSLRRLAEAVAHFDELLLNYPQSDKTAAALLKKGLAFLEMGRTDESLAVFKLLVGKFPMADESKIAQQKIKDIEDR